VHSTGDSRFDSAQFRGGGVAEALRAKIVRQEEAVQAMVDLFQVFCACLNSPGRP